MSTAPRVAVVTGANRGIGLAVTRGLIDRGLRVLALCRDPASMPDVAGPVVVVPCDLTDATSISAAADRVLAEDRLDVLIHNAGAYSSHRVETAAGHEQTFAVDVLGPHLLTTLLRDRLEATAKAHGAARIIQLAGIYHLKGQLDLTDLHAARRPWDPAAVNAAAQLARVSLTFDWARRLAAAGVTAVAVHPGPVLTDALNEAPWLARVLAHTVARPAFHSPEGGAAPVLARTEGPAFTGVFFRRHELHESCSAAYDLRLARLLREACEAAWDR